MNAAQRREDLDRSIQQILAGNRRAFLEVSRLVTGFLTRWQAYEFRDEWDDVVQEVVLATALAVRDGRLRNRHAIHSYMRTTARFQCISRLRRHIRFREEGGFAGDGETESPEVVAGTGDGFDPDRADLRRALEKIPARRRGPLVAVYLEGSTYEEAADETGVPLGSLKRHLRETLSTLREALGTAQVLPV